MARYCAYRPTKDEFAELLVRHYASVDAELRKRGLDPLLPDEVEGREPESPTHDPMRLLLPEDQWVPFAPPEMQEGAMLVDALIEVAGIFNPWDLVYRTVIPGAEGQARSVLPTPPLNE